MRWQVGCVGRARLWVVGGGWLVGGCWWVRGWCLLVGGCSRFCGRVAGAAGAAVLRAPRWGARGGAGASRFRGRRGGVLAVERARAVVGRCRVGTLQPPPTTQENGAPAPASQVSRLVTLQPPPTTQENGAWFPKNTAPFLKVQTFAPPRPPRLAGRSACIKRKVTSNSKGHWSIR